jgi:beta-lactamase class A
MGTVLSVWDPATRELPASKAPTNASLLHPQGGAELASQRFSRDATPGGMSPVPAALKLAQVMAPLSSTIQTLTTQYTGLTPGVFVVDLDTGNYVDLNGAKIFSSASLIKVPILVAFLQDIDAGKIRLDEMLTMRQEDIAGESGDLQDHPAGSQFSALDTATKMITISDNTATNMIIARLGGMEALNQRFKSWGLTETVLRSPLPDVTGTNTTTPKDLGNVLTMVSQGDLLSLRSRDRLFDIMRNTEADTLLPPGLGQEALIAHKTGTINSILGDTGIVDMPNGKRYVVAVIVQRPPDDERARELIQTISHEIYQYLNQSPDSGSAAPLPNGSQLPSTVIPSDTPSSPVTSPTSSTSPYASPTREASSPALNPALNNFNEPTSPATGAQ